MTLLDTYRAHFPTWAIFPLAPGSKQPMPASHGFKDARLPEEWAEAEWPAQANVGVATGHRSGLVVIDLDGGQAKQLFESMARQNFGDLPFFIVDTPHGWHVYYSIDSDFTYPCSQSMLGKNIDVRGDGGYVVGPYSEVSDLYYAIQRPDARLDGIPQWLDERIRVTRRWSGTNFDPYADEPSEIPELSIKLDIRIRRDADGRLHAEVAK